MIQTVNNTVLFIAAIISCSLSPIIGFSLKTSLPQHRIGTAIYAVESRRDLIRNAISGAILTLATNRPDSASASYSAYTNREKDWEQRNKKGDLNISTASSLRSQLKEIAPMNSEGAKIFCPNGMSAAVSPLQENKCSDTLLAMPSVYGRTEDIVGNSIPGFKTSYAQSRTTGGSSLSTSVGGFPKY